MLRGTGNLKRQRKVPGLPDGLVGRLSFHKWETEKTHLEAVDADSCHSRCNPTLPFTHLRNDL